MRDTRFRQDEDGADWFEMFETYIHPHWAHPRVGKECERMIKRIKLIWEEYRGFTIYNDSKREEWNGEEHGIVMKRLIISKDDGPREYDADGSHWLATPVLPNRTFGSVKIAKDHIDFILKYPMWMPLCGHEKKWLLKTDSEYRRLFK